MPVLAWVTWREYTEEIEEVDINKTMFGLSEVPKKEARIQLTKKFREDNKRIIKLTVRRYEKQPVWMKDEAWERLCQ